MRSQAVASARSLEVRREQSRLRAALRSGDLSLAEVLADPPAGFERVMLWQLCSWVPWFGREKLRRLNARAVADGVNLLVPLGRASVRSREWLAREAASPPSRVRG